MKWLKLYIVAAILLPAVLDVCGATADSEGVNGEKHFRIRYVVDKVNIDSTYTDNADRITDIYQFLEEVRRDSLLTITGVDFRGTASPEGPYERNLWLSENRLRTFKELIHQYIDLPDSLIFAESTDIPWNEFRQRIVDDENVPRRTKVLMIIDEGPRLVEWYNNRHIDARLLKLRLLDGGKVWKYLLDPILRDLRYGDAVFRYTYRLPAAIAGADLPLQVSLETTPLLEVALPREACTWTPRFYLKSNVLGWLTLSANLAAEIDLAPHWSFALPVYYSCWDYIKSTIKFRNFTLQPEFRYWPRWQCGAGNDGFFIGAHFGMMYFNFAIDGPYRYQDRDGKTPSLGGGIAIGFRKPISKNKRWHVEFSAGAGIYTVDYDVFHNTPDYKDGEWVRRKKKTFYGLDQASISFSYNFGINKYTRTYVKGGDR